MTIRDEQCTHIHSHQSDHRNLMYLEPIPHYSTSKNVTISDHLPIERRPRHTVYTLATVYTNDWYCVGVYFLSIYPFIYCYPFIYLFIFKNRLSKNWGKECPGIITVIADLEKSDIDSDALIWLTEFDSWGEKERVRAVNGNITNRSIVLLVGEIYSNKREECGTLERFGATSMSQACLRYRYGGGICDIRSRPANSSILTVPNY